MKKNNFRVKLGKNPVLFSAPHAVKHKRPSLKSELKGAEPWTDYIAENLADITDGFSIVSSTEGLRDPNFYSKQSSNYKKEVEKIIDKNKIKLVIDIHGLNDSHPYDFGLYWVKGYRKSQKIAYELAETVSKGDLRGVIFQFLNFSYWNRQETIGEFVAVTLGVPAIQLEIARYIREDSILREALIQNIAEFVNNFVSAFSRN